MFLFILALTGCAPSASSEPSPIAVAVMPTAQPYYLPEETEEAEELVEEPYAEIPAIPPADNFFEDYGVNNFIETSRDRISTFAVDVDTASYTVTRQYLQR